MFFYFYILPLPHLYKIHDKMHENYAGPTHSSRIIFLNRFWAFPGHKPTPICEWTLPLGIGGLGLYPR